MSDKLPTISVLMPVYNCEPYLDEAIRSIRDQTFTNFEFVIVNDGSTDRSLEIIHRHAAEDPRIVVLDRPNGGIVDALNAGLAVCRGEFIARMDGDDISLPDRLASQLHVIHNDPQLLVVGGQVERFGSQGKFDASYSLPLMHEAIDRELMKASTAIVHPASMLRRAAVLKVGGYRERFRYAEDLDLFLRLSEIGRVCNLPSTVLRYRVHKRQTSHAYNLSLTLAVLEAVKDAGRRRRVDVSHAIAKSLRMASWQATDLGEYVRGLRYACQAAAVAPAQVSWMRSLCRSVFFSLLRRRRAVALV